MLKIFYSLWPSVNVYNSTPYPGEAYDNVYFTPASPFTKGEEVLCVNNTEWVLGKIDDILPNGLGISEVSASGTYTVYKRLYGDAVFGAQQVYLAIYTDQEWELVYDTNDIIISGTSEEPRLYTFTITESTTLSLRRLDTVDTIPLPAGVTAYWSVYPVDDIQGIVPEGLTSPMLLERTYQYIEVDDPAEYTFQISLYDGSDVSYQHNDMLLYFVPKHYASRKETLLPSDVKALAYHALAEYGTLYPPLFATDPDYSVIPFQLIDTITKNGLSVFELQATAKYYYLQFDDYVVPIKKVSKLMATTYPCVYHENGKAYVYVPEQYQNFKWIIGLGSDTA
mgnify:FL=1